MDRRKFIQTCGLFSASMLVGNELVHASEPAIWKKNSNIKPIMGSWFEFLHGSDAEGKYWNSTLTQFTEKQWRAKVREISETGMQYLILIGVAGRGKTFYPSSLLPQFSYACADPLEAILSEADDCGIKFFIGNDFFGDYTNVNKMMTDKDIASLREKAMVEIAEKYGHHKSFYGWYYPNETGLRDTIDERTINYVNRCSQLAHELMPHARTMIAPYGIKSIRVDDNYVRQLERLDVDIIAYQDEIGVKKTRLGYAGKYFEQLYYAHTKAGRARLWADMEVFAFEGGVYKSALIPADFSRILHQMEDISPYVENILIYQYIGMMNKPGSIAFAGHPDSAKLYTDYMNWLKAQH
jgi:hypothetical protein